MFKCKVKALLWVQYLAQWYCNYAYLDSSRSTCVNNLDVQSLILLLKMFICCIYSNRFITQRYMHSA